MEQLNFLFEQVEIDEINKVIEVIDLQQIEDENFIITMIAAAMVINVKAHWIEQARYSGWKWSIQPQYPDFDPAVETSHAWTAYQAMPAQYKKLCQPPVKFSSRDWPVKNPIDDPDLDSYQYSNEVPDSLTFYEQGTHELKNEYLDASQEGRYLREYCVQRGGANHFLHLKSMADLRSVPQHIDPSWWLDQFPVEYDLAWQFANALRSLNMNRRHAMVLFEQMGWMKMPDVIAMMNRVIESADIIKEPDTGHISLLYKPVVSYCTGRQHLVPFFNNGYPGTIEWTNCINTVDIEKEFLIERMGQFKQALIEDEENDEDEFLDRRFAEDDDIEYRDSNNPYSTNRLFNGTESLSWEFQRLIETADWKKLSELRAGMFPTNPTKKKGGGVRPKFFYFTQEMKNHFWELYYRRKDELKNQKVLTGELSEDAKTASAWIKSLGKGAVTCRMIINAAEGRNFDLFGNKIEFHHKLTQAEINTLWAQYRAL